MIVRIGRPGSVLFIGALALGIVGMAPVARAPSPPAPTPTPAYSPPPREDSPFSESDTFCVPAANRFPTVARTDPLVRDHPVNVVLLTPAGLPDAESTAVDAETFAELVNRCGGIGGRRLDLHVIAETGNPLTDCVAATSRFRPLVVASLASSPAQQCIVRDQRTIMVTESDASNTELGASSGRLAATASSEGVERARLLDLVSSGRLDGRHVAVVAGTDPSGTAFEQMARSVLATKRIPLVDPGRADTVLEPTLDVAAVPLLTAVTASQRHGAPLDIYGFSTATADVLDQIRQLDPGTPARVLRASNVYAFAPVTDMLYRANREPNTFSEMCNQTYAAAVASNASPSTTLASGSPLSRASLRIADVCLALRIVARGLFYAGPELDQTALISAFHRLPYIDAAAPGGTPKPRPNQLVNEPVSRIAQVVVLTQVRAPCPDATPPTTMVGGSTCWGPVSGWDDGGRVVNVPLNPTAKGLSR